MIGELVPNVLPYHFFFCSRVCFLLHLVPFFLYWHLGWILVQPMTYILIQTFLNISFFYFFISFTKPIFPLSQAPSLACVFLFFSHSSDPSWRIWQVQESCEEHCSEQVGPYMGFRNEINDIGKPSLRFGKMSMFLEDLLKIQSYFEPKWSQVTFHPLQMVRPVHSVPDLLQLCHALHVRPHCPRGWRRQCCRQNGQNSLLCTLLKPVSFGGLWSFKDFLMFTLPATWAIGLLLSPNLHCGSDTENDRLWVWGYWEA